MYCGHESLIVYMIREFSPFFGLSFHSEECSLMQNILSILLRKWNYILNFSYKQFITSDGNITDYVI